ncbi:MAG: lipopolysaccharide biosynthesis protein [Actinomycetota bacterium]
MSASDPAGRSTDRVLLRNAYALAVNTAGTSVLGLAYWLVAARNYSPEIVGLSSAAISAALLISTISQLNLAEALARFLPIAGSQSRRFIRSSYAVTAGLALIIGLAAIPLIRLLPVTALGEPRLEIWICLTAALWCVFALQDGALTGLRRATWLPIENAVFGGLKLGFLAVFVSISPRFGILASWVIPMALVLVPVNLLMFRKALTADAGGSSDGGARGLGQMVPGIRRFVAFDYLGALFLLATTQLLPVLVTWRLGGRANGYFYVAWVMTAALDLAVTNICMSLTVEGAHEESRLSSLASTLGRRLAIAAAVGVPAGVAAAPMVLSLFGDGYRSNSTAVLRLLILAAPFRILIALWMSTARVRRLTSRITVMQACAATGVLTSSWLLMPSLGLTAVGWAQLAGQGFVALLVLPDLYRVIKPSRKLSLPGGESILAASGAPPIIARR